MDAFERLFLDHDAQALLLGFGATGAKQPGVHFLAGIGAVGADVGVGRVGVVVQEAQQPQFQRVHLGDKPLIVEIKAVGMVVLIQPLNLAVVGGLVAQMTV